MASGTIRQQKVAPVARANIRKFGWLAGVLVATGCGWLLVNNFCVTRAVRCTVGNQACNPAIQAELERSLVGESLFFTDYAQQLSTLPTLQSTQVIAIRKEIPQTLIVDLAEERPLYQLQLVEGKTLVVGEHGSLKNAGDSASDELPRVELQTESTPLLEQLNNAPRLPAELHTVFKSLITALRDNHLAFRKISWFSEDEIRVQLDTYQAILDTQNPAGSIEALAQILSSEEVKQLPQPLREVDLRFTLPVLRTVE